MSQTELEKTIFAYFVAEHAADLTIADRFYPYGELKLVWGDKVKIATRKFGLKVKMKAGDVAVALLDLLIERGAYSTKTNDFGGSMHNFKPDEYRKVIKDLQETDPIIQKSRTGGEVFWKDTFEALTKD